jgi:hypothetical protein
MIQSGIKAAHLAARELELARDRQSTRYIKEQQWEGIILPLVDDYNA